MAHQVDALRALGRGIDDAFAQFVGVMADLRARLQEMDGRLNQLLLLLEGQQGRMQVLGIVEGAVADVSKALQDASAAASPQRVLDAEDAARTALDEISDRARSLDAIANLTLITAQSLGVRGFHDYVADLRKLGRDVGEAVQRLADLMAGLRLRRALAGRQFRLATIGLTKVGLRIAELRERQAGTARLLTLSRDRAAEQASHLPEVTARETGSLLRAMQFADAVAQRLDHTERILARATDPTTALARAQIEAVVSDGRAVAQDVSASLAAIRAACADAARLLAVEDRSDAAAVTQALLMGRGMLDALLAEAGLAMAAIDQAAAEVSPVAATAERAVAEFGTVARATVQVRLAAFNAALLSRHGGEGRQAMTVLSIEVSGQAEACARSAHACRRAITDLSLPEDMAAFAGVAARTVPLRAAIEQAARALDGVMTALADVDALRREAIANLQHLDRTGAVAQEALAQILAGVEGLSKLVSGWPSEVGATGEDLGALMELYTMEAERAVHRRVVGLPDPAPLARIAAPALDDLLAEVLF